VSDLYTVVNSNIAYQSDLYFNTRSGIPVPLVVNGVIAGAPGNIAGLVAPASAIYNPLDGTFIFEQNTNQPANIDVGNIILRNPTTGSAGITIAPPTPFTTPYTLTLPNTPPPVTTILTMSSTGVVAASYTIDTNTLGIGLSPAASNAIGVKSSANFQGTPEAGGQNIIVSATNNTHKLQMIRGYVGFSNPGTVATIISGEGFTVTYIPPLFQIIFLNPFLDIPALVTTGNYGFQVWSVPALTTNLANVQNSGGPTQVGPQFSFIAIGQSTT